MLLKFTEDILPVTDFRNNAADILSQLTDTRRPILLTQRGRAAAVLLDVREYQKLLDRVNELEKLISPEARASLDTESSTSDAELMAELERWIGQEG